MRNIARSSFKVTLYVTAALILAAAAVTLLLTLRPPAASQLPVLKFELDIFKAILAGFVVSMLGILIPALASETRQRFEQRKESRVAYSEAKTGIDYLKLRLAVANLAEAGAAVQAAHFLKHQAELYDDFVEWLDKRYDGKMSADEWDTRMYGRLFGARKTLEENAQSWDRLSPAERIALLDGVLPTESELDEKPKRTEPQPGGWRLCLHVHAFLLRARRGLFG